VQDNTVEQVEVGALEDVSGTDILRSMDAPGEPRNALKRQQLKKEAFIDRLQSVRSPYSKTQRRRFKKRQEEQVGGGLDAIHVAISALDDYVITDGDDGHTEEEPAQPRAKVKPKLGQIGEGKGNPLSRNQRKRALEMERLRAPMILANPDYASNPFQTIRTHAQNTLLKHECTTS
jgi:hypothetical protein